MKKVLLGIVFAFMAMTASAAPVINVYGRDYQSLNGRWDAIVDLYDQGTRLEVFENKSAEGNTDFYEYAFEGGAET